MENSATLNTNAALQRTRKALSDRYRIHVIDRAAHILDCFGFDHQELSVREIGAKTHLHHSTAHRILIALEYNALIQQSPENGKYRLGIKLAWLANGAIRRSLGAGEIVMPGALCAAADVSASDFLQASFDGLGTDSVRFA